MIRSVHRRTALLGLLGAAVLTVAGCQYQPGAAAFVGSNRITSAELTTDVKNGLADPNLPAQARGDTATYRQVVLSLLIQRRLLEDAARRKGIHVTSGEVNQVISQDEARLGGRRQLEATLVSQVGVPKQLAGDFYRTQLLFQKLGAALTGAKPPLSGTAATQAAQQARGFIAKLIAGPVRVTVNPRYGRFDARQFGVVPVTSSLVKVTPSSAPATPAPGG